ncbi:MAG: LemA family protein [Acidimicrobiia bacterium]|nr:LemA family protein [Acidimicrobiia bacterium]
MGGQGRAASGQRQERPLVTEWTARGGRGRFLLIDEHRSGIEVDARGARFDGDRTLLTKGIADRRRITEKALVSGDRLYVLGPVRVTGDGRLRVHKQPDPGGPEAGLDDVRTRLPLWLTQGGESDVARTLLLVALAATVVTVVGVAAFTAVEPTEDQFGRSALKLREEGSLLLPALTASAVVIGAFALGYTWRLWNRLVELRWQAAHAWSLIEVAVTARAGLIANLFATTQAGAAAHERTTLVDIATGRGGLPRAPGVAAVDVAVAAENRDRAALVARIDAHPELGVDALFGQLFTQLVATENRLAACRRFYNDAVTVLADRTGTVPGLLLKPLVAPEVPPLLAFELHDVAAPSVVGSTAPGPHAGPPTRG